MRFKYWLYVFSYVGLIYSTLYVARPVCSFLKSIIPLSLSINILCYGLLLFLLIGILWKVRIRRFSSYFILSFIAGVYIYGLITIQHPEEKIHFIEYGILSYLVFQALHLDVKVPRTYIYGFLIVSILGWMDEGIQYLLPNRYYQIEDVILNSISGTLGLLLLYVFNREHYNQETG